MQKTLALFFLLALFCFNGQGVNLYAQWDAPAYDESIPDDDEDGQEGSDFDNYIPDIYAKGDQTITISLGTIFPTVFLDNNGEEIHHNFIPPVGGVLSIAYSHYLGSHFFLGGEIGFLTAYTKGKNAVFIIPIGVRAGWQFVFNRFEFPLYAAIGIAPQRYLDLGYFGMYLKGAASAYYRFHPNWSFGLVANWTWYPQWPMKEGKRTPEFDIDANIAGVMLSLRYHF